MFKPDQHSTVSPYLIVNGASDTIDFLVSAFDGVETMRIPHENDTIMHAEVRIDDSIIMLSDGNADWPPTSANVHIYVPDVDETYRRALAAGGESLQEPVKKDTDADKRGGVRDAGGTNWWMATRVG